MSKRLFDTNKLCSALRRLRSDSKPEEADELAKELIDAYNTNAICSPVTIEVLAGVRDPMS